jgi:hypothetical protein
VAGTEPEPLRVGQRLDGIQHPVEVEQRLAHPHEHDIGQPAAVDGQSPRGATDLIDDLRRFEVARQAQLPGRAERAADRAAGLRRDAQRVALALPGSCRVAHQDGLHQRPVGEPVERLLGQAGVGKEELRIRDGVPSELRIERVPEWRRQGPHVAGGRRVRAPQPVGDLPGPERWLAARREPRLEDCRVERGQSGARVERLATGLKRGIDGRERSGHGRADCRIPPVRDQIVTSR